MIANSWPGGICVLLPDGRLWAGKLDSTWKNISGRFAEGSNWVDVAGVVAGIRSGSMVALKSDGTLWELSGGDAPRQVGPDSDWKKVVAGTSFFLALKQDGTIWGWGSDDFGILSSRDQNGRGITISDPVQVRSESDWVDVFVLSPWQAAAVKRDGSVWKWGCDATGVNGRIHTYSDYHQLVRLNMAGTNWSSLAGGYIDPILGVRTDGSLWAEDTDLTTTRWADDLKISLFGSPVSPDELAKSMRIGNKSDWVSLSWGDFEFLALEADGTLWAMDRRNLKTKRPSKYRDWLAVTEYGGMDWAVAKDGTICCWGAFSRPVFYEERNSHRFILRPSRRPLASLNILDAN
jgi:alpha-tubulin suppressor-like RCC1 family protein